MVVTEIKVVAKSRWREVAGGVEYVKFFLTSSVSFLILFQKQLCPISKLLFPLNYHSSFSLDEVA